METISRRRRYILGGLMIARGPARPSKRKERRRTRTRLVPPSVTQETPKSDPEFNPAGLLGRIDLHLSEEDDTNA